MKLKGPIVTLVAGAAVAGALLALDLRATGTRPAARSASAGGPSTPVPAASPSTPPPAAPSPPPSPAVPSAAAPVPPVTYAGYTTGGAAPIAIAVTGGLTAPDGVGGEAPRLARVPGAARLGDATLNATRVDGSPRL